MASLDLEEMDDICNTIGLTFNSCAGVMQKLNTTNNFFQIKLYTMTNLFLKTILFSLFGSLPEKRGRLPPKENHLFRSPSILQTISASFNRWPVW